MRSSKETEQAHHVVTWGYEPSDWLGEGTTFYFDNREEAVRFAERRQKEDTYCPLFILERGDGHDKQGILRIRAWFYRWWLQKGIMSKYPPPDQDPPKHIGVYEHDNWFDWVEYVPTS
jgi:hypothetical protein